MSSPKPKKTKNTPRSVALAVLLSVLKQGKSLSQLKADFQVLDDSRDRSLATELVNGVLRWRWKLDAVLSPHLKKKLKNKDIDVQLILYIAVYELIELDIPDYATVNEAVALVKSTKKNWARGLVNAILRNIIRSREGVEKIADDEAILYSHPDWLLGRLKLDWPDRWQAIATANNSRPPIWLRVNRKQFTGAEYQERLSAIAIEHSVHPSLDEAIKVESRIDVTSLPGFEAGAVSVQDAGAQYAAHLLAAEQGESILDLCAAPGGKTSHVLESVPGLRSMVAVDNVESRMARVRENLTRLNLDAQLVTGDATDSRSWWDGELFDRILVDAPCSATGVIRRHPDIKSLRREDDLDSLVQLQQQIIDQAWTMLADGGRLLYVTCSVLKMENQAQIERFLSRHEDADEVVFDMEVGVRCEFGWQLLPGEMDMDGFYYACLKKRR